MNVEDQDLIVSFVGTYGRGPSIGELMLMKEAKASVALDKSDHAQTYSVETVTPDGGFSVQGPVPQGEGGVETWEEKEIQRLQKLLLMAIQAIETAWDEGAMAMKKHGRRKGMPENPYRISEVLDDPEGDV